MSAGARIDRSVPLGTQLFWQLRYQIATGEYQPGERLPTVRELAAALRVNANTIRGVYARLQEEGWVVARRKVGTVVADPLPRPHHHELELILDRAFDAAAASGISSDELAAAAFARAAQRAAVGVRRPLFVECDESELPPFLTALQAELGDRIEALEGTTVEGLRARLDRGGIDAIVTTIYHAEEVRRLVPELPVVSMMLAPAFNKAVSEVSHLPAGTRVAVVCHCDLPRMNVVNAVRKLRPGLEIIAAESMDEAPVATAAVVIAWEEGAADRVTPGQRYIPWGYAVDPVAVVHVRRQLGL